MKNQDILLFNVEKNLKNSFYLKKIKNFLIKKKKNLPN